MLLEKHCWAEVSLDALRENFRLVQAAAGNTPVMAVVKANAYGHGDAAVAACWRPRGLRPLPSQTLPRPFVCAAPRLRGPS